MVLPGRPPPPPPWGSSHLCMGMPDGCGGLYRGDLHDLGLVWKKRRGTVLLVPVGAA